MYWLTALSLIGNKLDIYFYTLETFLCCSMYQSHLCQGNGECTLDFPGQPLVCALVWTREGSTADQCHDTGIFFHIPTVVFPMLLAMARKLNTVHFGLSRYYVLLTAQLVCSSEKLISSVSNEHNCSSVPFITWQWHGCHTWIVLLSSSSSLLCRSNFYALGQLGSEPAL